MSKRSALALAAVSAALYSFAASATDLPKGCQYASAKKLGIRGQYACRGQMSEEPQGIVRVEFSDFEMDGNKIALLTAKESDPGNGQAPEIQRAALIDCTGALSDFEKRIGLRFLAGQTLGEDLKPLPNGDKVGLYVLPTKSESFMLEGTEDTVPREIKNPYAFQFKPDGACEPIK